MDEYEIRRKLESLLVSCRDILPADLSNKLKRLIESEENIKEAELQNVYSELESFFKVRKTVQNKSSYYETIKRKRETPEGKEQSVEKILHMLETIYDRTPAIKTKKGNGGIRR